MPFNCRRVEVEEMSEHNGNKSFSGTGLRLKVGLAEMLKGGVIMDVVNKEQAQIAEKSGAVAVMALERVPSDIRKEGGVARMADPTIISDIMDTVSIPVMAKARIGHFVECQVRTSNSIISLPQLNIYFIPSIHC